MLTFQFRGNLDLKLQSMEVSPGMFSEVMGTRKLYVVETIILCQFERARQECFESLPCKEIAPLSNAMMVVPENVKALQMWMFRARQRQIRRSSALRV